MVIAGLRRKKPCVIAKYSWDNAKADTMQWTKEPGSGLAMGQPGWAALNQMLPSMGRSRKGSKFILNYHRLVDAHQYLFGGVTIRFEIWPWKHQCLWTPWDKRSWLSGAILQNRQATWASPIKTVVLNNTAGLFQEGDQVRIGPYHKRLCWNWWNKENCISVRLNVNSIP